AATLPRHQRSIQFDGNERDYEVQVPASYDNSQPVPLVFDIHGYSSNKDQQQLVSGIRGKAEDEGFVVVRPNGYGLVSRSWNGGDFCCGDAHAQGLDDVGLVKAIVTEVSAQVCVDPTRIYATGISNGGALSHRLACEAGDVFAAVAPVSYPLDFTPFSGCQPSRPMPVMHLHGTNDLVVPYGGGLNAPATPDSFNYWGQVNGCSGLPTETYTKGSSHCDTYDSCDAGVEVTLCTVNGGHVLYANLDGVPVDDLAWDFLSRFTLP
ncbi:MAG: prolyl oligopeptidase family serine peptidase, partial [Deltaproteobacteria bacterium]|nr:prolyl oligopeptidase family serine peptidase [Deltaproteobacteria bacterium]MBW2530461.1 prolyl oligopeptidase family serine peptidase [Deltaproteobacteria bacterium]